MAEIIENFPDFGGHYSKYPWSQWFDGRAWKLTRGTDFDSPSPNFDAAIRAKARTKGLKVRICRRGDVIHVQAEKPNA